MSGERTCRGVSALVEPAARVLRRRSRTPRHRSRHRGWASNTGFIHSHTLGHLRLRYVQDLPGTPYDRLLENYNELSLGRGAAQPTRGK